MAAILPNIFEAELHAVKGAKIAVLFALSGKVNSGTDSDHTEQSITGKQGWKETSPKDARFCLTESQELFKTDLKETIVISAL